MEVRAYEKCESKVNALSRPTEAGSGGHAAAPVERCRRRCDVSHVRWYLWDYSSTSWRTKVRDGGLRMSNDDDKSAHGRDATPRAITRYPLPRSYAAASAEAARAGKTYLRAVAADVLLIVVGAAFVSVSPDSQRARRVINLLGASCFAGGLVVSKITSAKERDREWLRARSRAEDVKSTAWRFMTA